MSIPTVTVTVRAHDQSGDPLVGAVVTARLSTTERYNGLVVPEITEAVTDSAGLVELQLFPNALGVAGSSYRVTIKQGTAKFLDAVAVVPNSACALDQIIQSAPFPPVNEAQQALTAAQAALASVTAQAQEAEASATAAASSAAAAAASQDTATTQAANAATSAANAAASELAAATSATAADASQISAGSFATTAQAAAQTATTAANNAVAVVTGGTAALTATPGRIPIAGASGTLDESWLNTVAGVNAAALHRSPNAITALFVYDTSKDSDGGAWTERCQHTSWWNEPINGRWLGAQASEAAARATGATTGDYFQLTTDGRFYRLNATSGTTEVFRGNKRDFPRLSAIVAEASNVTVYDLTEPGRPMFMRFVATATGTVTAKNLLSGAASAAAVNGRICFGGSATNLTGLTTVDFVSDRATVRFATGGHTWAGTIATRNSTGGYSVVDASVGAIANNTVNSVAMTVLPDAPVDPVSGLQVPTIALATAGGVSVIRHDGVVRNSSSTLAFNTVTLAPQLLTAARTADATIYAAQFPGSLGASFALTTRTGTQAPGFGIGNTNGLLGVNRSELVRRSAIAATVQKIRAHESDLSRSAVATITNTHNTGHLPGDIRRAYLADAAAGSATGTVPDRSYRAASAPITGTLTRTAVANAAQMVAYSGFSAANYLREPYSADLDFGTGEWSASAWVNVPVSLPPVESFPFTSAELYDPSWNTSVTGWTVPSGWSNDGTKWVATSTSNNLYRSLSTPVTGLVAITFDVTFTGGTSFFITVGINQSVSFQWFVTSSGRYTRVFSAAAGSTVIAALGNNFSGSFSISSVKAIGSALIADRAHTSGAKLDIGVNALGQLTATAFDGTTTRTVTTTAAYNTATWHKAEACYTTDGTLSIRVNGVEVAATRGNPLLTLNNSNAVLTIGNSFNLGAPFPGSIALLKLGATVPTADQSVWMYEQEKQMFREGAQVCLPDSGSIVDLAYDEATDKWLAVSSANESEWAGLVRTSVTPVPAGTYSRIAAGGGVQLLARATTAPGVDVVIPPYGLREELVRRAEGAARLARNIATFDFLGGFTANTTSGSTAITNVSGLLYPTSYIGARVTGTGIPANTVVTGVSGTTIYLSAAATATATAVAITFTDFILPVGYEARTVTSGGTLRREGATQDFTRLFDGFRETIRFAVAPAATTWVQIAATRSVQ